MARDVWTECMRRELGGSTEEERQRVEAILREWDFRYHRSFTRQIRSGHFRISISGASKHLKRLMKNLK